MKQIPSEDEYCGTCLRAWQDPDFCPVYDEVMDSKWIGNSYRHKRLPQCLSDKPQVLTEQERKAIYLKAITVYGGLNQQTPKEDIDEQHR